MPFRAETRAFEELESLLDRRECVVCGEAHAVPVFVPRVAQCELSKLDREPPPIALCPRCRHRHVRARWRSRATFWLFVPWPLILSLLLVELVPFPWLSTAIAIGGGLLFIRVFRVLRQKRALEHPALITGGSGELLELGLNDGLENESPKVAGPYRNESIPEESVSQELEKVVELRDAKWLFVFHLFFFGLMAFIVIQPRYPTVRLDNPSGAYWFVRVDGEATYELEPWGYFDVRLSRGPHSFEVWDSSNSHVDFLVYEVERGDDRLLCVPRTREYFIGRWNWHGATMRDYKFALDGRHTRGHIGRWVPLVEYGLRM